MPSTALRFPPSTRKPVVLPENELERQRAIEEAFNEYYSDDAGTLYSVDEGYYEDEGYYTDSEGNVHDLDIFT